jgi:uncharacterized membrane-anchored protein
VKLSSAESLRVLLPVIAAISLVSFGMSGLIALTESHTVPAVISFVIAGAWAVVLVLFAVERHRRRARTSGAGRQ